MGSGDVTDAILGSYSGTSGSERGSSSSFSGIPLSLTGSGSGSPSVSGFSDSAAADLLCRRVVDRFASFARRLVTVAADRFAGFSFTADLRCPATFLAGTAGPALLRPRLVVATDADAAREGIFAGNHYGDESR